ncbi:hypothetical protein CBS101457_003077 [Exobasidium rhododendri]|nr:hypothetical protein CBS101457_003077 [Exobasidium rhododendri]
MAPSLKLSAGPDLDSLSVLYVNDESKPLDVSTDAFEGRIVVRIKGFTGQLPDNKNDKEESNSTEVENHDTHYFDQSYAKNCTWSIGIQGRFKEEVDVDEVEFGNLFDHSIKDKLPYGTGVALAAVKYIDPNLHHDLYADKPWAFSPLICTMTRINVERLQKDAGSKEDWPAFPQGKDESDYVQEDTSVLLCKKDSTKEVVDKLEENGHADKGTLSSLRSSNDANNAHKTRVKFWGNQRVRQATQFTHDDIITMDFCQGYIRFDNLHLAIAGMEFDLVKYATHNQVVNFLCRNKTTEKVYFVVQFQLLKK